MFEEQSYENILKRMTQRVPDGFDVREGSIIFIALSACAAELASTYIELDWLLNQAFGETASREALISIAHDTKGMSPREASCAVWKGSFSPSSAEVSIGSRWNCEKMNLTVTEKIEDGAYLLRCETAGSGGNALTPGARLLPLEYSENIESAVITSIEIYGDDEESTEDFRERWKKSLEIHSFGGNIADYREKVLSVDGVGGCKVFRTTDTVSTVGIIIIGEGNTVPTDSLINSVQTVLDPKKDGEGEGLVPIGHKAVVSGVTEAPVNMEVEVVLPMGITAEDVQNGINAAVDGYFASLAASWEKSSLLTVRISELVRAILSVPNVEDVSIKSLGEGTANIEMDISEIPKRGTVICTLSES